MKKILKVILKLLIFVFLTITTQIGGIALFISILIQKKLDWDVKKGILIFIVIYSIFTFVFVPLIAPIFGREKVKHHKTIQPTNFMTVVLNRNYVHPELNQILEKTEKRLEGTGIVLNYLDANFPFLDGFPLLPHLSHNDGKKLDLSLVYETKNGAFSKKQKSVSGYGVYENPKPNEYDQIRKCIESGYIQYDFPKYLTFGRKNSELEFSAKGTKLLINTILKEKSIGKIFIEPHLKQRLGLNNPKIRYHGCQAVRHDDHIHIQLK